MSSYSVSVQMQDLELIDDAGICHLDANRSHRLLELIKAKIGRDGLRELFQQELELSAQLTENWVKRSNGNWESASMVMTFQNISMERYLAYFEEMVKLNLQDSPKYEMLFRSAHPDHLMNIVQTQNTSIVVENFGEHEYPWELQLELGGFTDSMPVKQDKDYSAAMVATGKNSNGTIILYATHEFRNCGSDMQIKFSALLPKEAPKELLRGHMRHFAVEWRNWYYDIVNKK